MGQILLISQERFAQLLHIVWPQVMKTKDKKIRLVQDSKIRQKYMNRKARNTVREF